MPPPAWLNHRSQVRTRLDDHVVFVGRSEGGIHAKYRITVRAAGRRHMTATHRNDGACRMTVAG
jgi:hypothetical protein